MQLKILFPIKTFSLFIYKLGLEQILRKVFKIYIKYTAKLPNAMYSIFLELTYHLNKDRSCRVKIYNLSKI